MIVVWSRLKAGAAIPSMIPAVADQLTGLDPRVIEDDLTGRGQGNSYSPTALHLSSLLGAGIDGAPTCTCRHCPPSPFFGPDQRSWGAGGLLGPSFLPTVIGGLTIPLDSP